jgi:hypothetical protein
LTDAQMTTIELQAERVLGDRANILLKSGCAVLPLLLALTAAAAAQQPPAVTVQL